MLCLPTDLPPPSSRRRRIADRPPYCRPTDLPAPPYSRPPAVLPPARPPAAAFCFTWIYRFINSYKIQEHLIKTLYNYYTSRQYVSEKLILSYDKIRQVKENIVNGSKNMKKVNQWNLCRILLRIELGGFRGCISTEMVNYIDFTIFYNAKNRKIGLNRPLRARKKLKIRLPGYFLIPRRLARSLAPPDP